MLDHNQMFISSLTEKAGITYDTIIRVYKEAGTTDQSEVCSLFMDKFQMSFGFANTLAVVVIEEASN